MFSFRRFKIKLLNWEYWPMPIVYLPTYAYYLYLSIRARSFFFFSATNPGIETGGMFFESKWKIFEGIPSFLYPTTILVTNIESIQSVVSKMKLASIDFPIIAKPDRGERGWKVKKINSLQDLISYVETAPDTYLIQRYVDYPIELSVFYVRHPSEHCGKITSVTYKKLLSVTGDGRSTLQELIIKKDRAYLQKEKLFVTLKDELQYVLPFGTEKLLVPYGNHVLGAEFLDYERIIDQQLLAAFETISRSIKGFYYGRFDIRTLSIEDLKQGKNMYILELNGTGAEPAHIYDPKYSFLKAQKTLMWHYKKMFDIAQYNKKYGAIFMSYKEYRILRKQELAYKTIAN